MNNAKYKRGDDFDCPHCGKRIIWEDYHGEEATIGIFFEGYPHVKCHECKKCCGCTYKMNIDWKSSHTNEK